MNAPANAINMAGAVVQGFQVLEYVRPPALGGARWWVLCLACQHQQQERGCNIRKAQKRAGWRLVCKGCGE